MNNRDRWVVPLLLFAFLLSGFSSLVYEIVWVKMLVTVFGVTYFAIATIVTSFMAGLALGALVAGRLVDRRIHPLLFYVLLEAFVGGFALIFPDLVAALMRWYPQAVAQLDLGHLGLVLVRFGLCFALLAPPTTAMGASLPVLTKFLVARQDHLGREVGRLYGINTLGAAAGCLLAGYLFVPVLGIAATTRLAAGATFLAGATALGLLLFVGPTWRRGEVAAGDMPAEPTSAWPGSPRVLLGVIFLSGFTSMAYELLWTRVFTMLYVNPQTYVFSTVLFLYLLGIGLGSALYGRLGRRTSPLATFSAVQLLIGASALVCLLLPLLFRLADLHGQGDGVNKAFSRWLFQSVGVSFFVVDLLFMVAAVFVPGVLFGVLFPLCSRLFVRDLRVLGRGVGSVYFVITLGGIVGSFVAGFFLMPTLSAKSSILLVAAVSLGLGCFVGVRYLGWTVRARPLLAVAVAVALVGLALLGALLPASVFVPAGASDRVLFYRDGRNSSSAVVNKSRMGSHKVLFTNGEWVPGFGGDIHLPVLLHPAPRSVLLVAFGTGSAVASLVRYPSFQRLTVVDLDDNQRATAPYFVDAAALDADPRLQVVFNDGRNFLYTSSASYDVIINDPGTYSLYREMGTRQFLRICRARLAPGGMFLQKAHIKLITWGAFRREVATFLSVFPDATLWSLDGHFLMVLVGTRGVRPEPFDALARRVASLRPDLRALGAGEIAGRLLLPAAALRHLSAGAELFTDDRIPAMNELFIRGSITDQSPVEVAKEQRNLVYNVGRVEALQPESFEHFQVSGPQQRRHLAELRRRTLARIQRHVQRYVEQGAP